jgi:hypothetical protein
MLPSFPVTFGSPGQLPGPANPGHGHGPTPDPTPRDSTGDPAARRKPTRLSLACNTCRKRKVRCDAGQPKCGNCTARNERCETTDLRRPAHGSTPRARGFPNGHGRQRSLGRPEPEPEPVMHLDDWTGSNASTAGLDQDQVSVIANIGDHVPPQTPGACGYTASESAVSPNIQHGRTGQPAGAISWVSRAYRETHDMTPSQEPAPGGTPDAVVNTDDTSYRVKVSIIPPLSLVLELC